jgi:hypothetical protein
LFSIQEKIFVFGIELTFAIKNEKQDQAWLLDYDDLYFIDVLGRGTSSVGMFILGRH